MNQKEISELRRTVSPGEERHRPHLRLLCQWQSGDHLLSDESLGTMPQEEAEKYLGLLKKALSGAPGRTSSTLCLRPSRWRTARSTGCLMGLRDSQLKDGAVRQAFYEKVIESLDMEGSNYLLLLAHDAYDVPYKGRDGEAQDGRLRHGVPPTSSAASARSRTESWSWAFLPGRTSSAAVSPARLWPRRSWDSSFPPLTTGPPISTTPCSTPKRPTRSTRSSLTRSFIRSRRLSAAEQREAFESALTDALEDACSMEVVQAVHERLRDQIVRHKEEHDPEPLAVTAGEIGDILKEVLGPGGAGVSAFLERCGEQLGDHAALNPANLIESGKFEGGHGGGQNLRGPGAQLPGGDPGHRRAAVSADPRRRRHGQRPAGPSYPGV